MVKSCIEKVYFFFYINVFLERTVFVSQYCGKPLQSFLGKNDFKYEVILNIAYQILIGLDELHQKNILHGNLSSENILLQQNETDIKLFNYGLFYATENGKLVSFPIL